MNQLEELKKDVQHLKEAYSTILEKLDEDFWKKHDSHHEYVEILIAKEAKKLKLWDAIIEKTITSLIWSAIVFVAYAIWNFLTKGR